MNVFVRAWCFAVIESEKEFAFMRRNQAKHSDLVTEANALQPMQRCLPILSSPSLSLSQSLSISVSISLNSPSLIFRPELFLYPSSSLLRFLSHSNSVPLPSLSLFLSFPLCLYLCFSCFFFLSLNLSLPLPLSHYCLSSTFTHPPPPPPRNRPYHFTFTTSPFLQITPNINTIETSGQIFPDVNC